MTAAVFNAHCSSCDTVKPHCATVYRAISNTNNQWSTEPESWCLDCRRERQPHYRLDAKHKGAEGGGNMSKAIKIGSTLWIFDQNIRVYPKGSGIGGQPIWRKHWRPEKVVSETSRSWVTTTGIKVAKHGTLPPGIAASQEDIDRRQFVVDHGWKIANAVQRVRDYATLKAIAELIGYKPAAE